MFVVHGRLENLDYDAVLIPTDDDTAEKLRAVGAEVTALAKEAPERWGSSRPSLSSSGAKRE